MNKLTEVKYVHKGKATYTKLMSQLMTAVKFVPITFLLAVSFDHNHKIICCYFALHVVASYMIPKLKWSKVQENLSLHRLLDTFPNMIAVENKG